LCTSFKLEAKGARGYSVWIKSNPCGGHVKFVLFYHIEISWIYTYIPNIEKKNPGCIYLHMSLSSADTTTAVIVPTKKKEIV